MVYPLESNITWSSGFDTMTTYTFGPERIAHSFCSTCGTSMCAKSTDPNFFADNRAMNVSQPRPLLSRIVGVRNFEFGMTMEGLRRASKKESERREKTNFNTDEHG